MARPRKFACLICGKRLNLSSRVRRHIFNHHLLPTLENDLLRFCWCQGGMQYPIALSFRAWQEHLSDFGGLQSHYATNALNIGG